MRILLTGGGTGGHIFPLIAVSRKLREIVSEEEEILEFLFVGEDKFSKNILKQEGIGKHTIWAAKLRRYFSAQALLDILKIPISLLQAYWHVFWFMPDVIFSKGGYDSVPVVFIGWLFRIPIIIHESDTIPGVANKIVAKFAKSVLVSFAMTEKFIAVGRAKTVGNPTRDRLFLDVPQFPDKVLEIVSSKPLIFVLGGSQGAREINDMIFLALKDIVRKYEVVHQCGEKDFERMKTASVVEIKDFTARKLYHPFAMLNEKQMASAYASASIIVSRSGSGAIFEIAQSGKPSIMVPYFDAAGSHQFKNAKAYEVAGACRILRGTNILPHVFINVIDSILGDFELYKKMSQSAKSFAKPNATQEVAEEIMAYL